MKLWEALRLLDEGRKLTMEGWNDGVYIYHDKETDKIRWNNNNVCSFSFVGEDKWKIFDGRKGLAKDLSWLKDAYNFTRKICPEKEDCLRCPFQTDVELDGKNMDMCDVFDKIIIHLNKEYKLD